MFCGSIFFFFFLSGWRRPSGVHTQPDCTLSLFFLFSFLSLFRNLLPGGKRRRRRAFWFVPLMCRIYSGKEEEGGGPPCPIQVESCRRWQQPKKGGTPDEVRIFFSLLFCVLSIYPPTNLTDPPTDHQRPFLCVCVYLYLLGSWRLSHLDRENSSVPAARVFKCTVSLSIL